jgi:hypothetical protein
MIICYFIVIIKYSCVGLLENLNTFHKVLNYAVFDNEATSVQSIRNSVDQLARLTLASLIGAVVTCSSDLVIQLQQHQNNQLEEQRPSEKLENGLEPTLNTSTDLPVQQHTSSAQNNLLTFENYSSLAKLSVR